MRLLKRLMNNNGDIDTALISIEEMQSCLQGLKYHGIAYFDEVDRIKIKEIESNLKSIEKSLKIAAKHR